VAPIEVFFGTIVFIFMLIGLVRGFLKELGVTLVMMFVLYVLSQFEPFLERGLARVVDLGQRALGVQSRDLLECWLFILIIVATAFISYEGETLAFAGQPLRGSQGILLGILTGGLNGYLIAGSIWFYMDKFGYPIAWLNFSQDKLSKTAQAIVPLLPINLLGKPLILDQSLLLFLSLGLLIARVVR